MNIENAMMGKTGFEAYQAVSQNVFLTTFILFMIPSLVMLLIATMNKSVLSPRFLGSFIPAELLRIVIFGLASTGLLAYWTK